MKTLVSVLVMLVGFSAAAGEIKFKSIGAARSAGTIHALCFTRSGNPQLTFTFDQTFSSFEGSAGTLVLVQPEEGTYVRDWTGPAVPTFAWSLSPSVGDMTISGLFQTPYNESISVFIKEGNTGKFAGKVDYHNYTTGVVVSRDVRCYLTNQNWKP